MAGQYSGSDIHNYDELTQASISVGTSQTELFTGGSRNARRQVIRVYNDGSNDCFIGPSGVTASGSTKGEKLVKGGSITYTLGDVALYAITASGTTTLIITELA